MILRLSLAALLTASITLSAFAQQTTEDEIDCDDEVNQEAEECLALPESDVTNVDPLTGAILGVVGLLGLAGGGGGGGTPSTTGTTGTTGTN